jgi:hypothetical protein
VVAFQNSAVVELIAGAGAGNMVMRPLVQE